jgi:pyruvate/2-oxoglutarate dehydrogenase complex dihydrolipoamide acyltransferase (E2) component
MIVRTERARRMPPAQRREAFAREGVPLTLTAYFVRAAVAAIRAVPEANSRWTDSALELYEQVHVGIATAVEGTGLVVPVLRDAGARDLLETARGLEELVRRAREGHLRPADVRGGTFTLSNHGVSGSLFAAPIITMLTVSCEVNAVESSLASLSRLTGPIAPIRLMMPTAIGSGRFDVITANARKVVANVAAARA